MAEDPSSATGPAGSSAELALELRGITKRFGSFVANDAIDLDLREGEVHALLGENGAGKSTLMNVLYGLYRADEGEILVHGRRVEMTSSADAIRLGIGMVHQHFMLIPVMSVVENIVLGAEPQSHWQLDLATARERVRELSARYGLVVDPDATIEELGVGQQQRVEILKALYRDARVLILDEPTAVLTPQEVDELFAVLRALVERGTSIILITHKLHEVLEVADRISVLRRGKKVATLDREGASERGLAELMVGRDVLLDVERGAAHPGGKQPKRAVLAVAGPVTNNRCVMTNSPWVIDGNELQPALGFDSVHVLNDFEVVAWSLPALQPADLIPLGGQDGLPGSRCWWSGPEPVSASPAWSNATAPGWRSSPRQATRLCRRRTSARSA